MAEIPPTLNPDIGNPEQPERPDRSQRPERAERPGKGARDERRRERQRGGQPIRVVYSDEVSLQGGTVNVRTVHTLDENLRAEQLRHQPGAPRPLREILRDMQTVHGDRRDEQDDETVADDDVPPTARP